MIDNYIQNLKKRLSQPLPGEKGQARMANFKRQIELAQRPMPDNHKVACVMILLFLKEEAWHLVLIQRTKNPKDKHSGQISFPGGRHETTDGELVNVALRETTEEIGIAAENIEILGRLTDLYIPVSNFRVFPFVGLLKKDATFTPQLGEVEQILTFPIAHFHNLANQKTIDMEVYNGMVLKEVPYFDLDGKVLWGATAMIISEFLMVNEEFLTMND
jgi:8-oxo-dGTP pyrophosphatase MutT (NUDIX family)